MWRHGLKEESFFSHVSLCSKSVSPAFVGRLSFPTRSLGDHYRLRGVWVCCSVTAGKHRRDASFLPSQYTLQRIPENFQRSGSTGYLSFTRPTKPWHLSAGFCDGGCYWHLVVRGQERWLLPCPMMCRQPPHQVITQSRT